MNLPAGYVVDRVLSAGPVAFVALARGPGGGACVVKAAAIARAIPGLENEAAVLRALGGAGVAGVPRVLDSWAEGFALERLGMPTLRAWGDAFHARGASGELWNRVARAAFERLAAVHGARDGGGSSLDVVHGDVSPGNVYAGDDGSTVALADFGLALWRGSAPIGGAFRGTLLYAAPEVARGERFDARADDFALAASVLHVATGIALREGDSSAVTLVDAGTRPLDASHPWRKLAPKLFDRALADALFACLAFDPRDRPRETPTPC